MIKQKQVSLTLTKSKFGRKPGHRECVEGLGLHRLHQRVTVPDTPCIRGMIRQVAYLLRVEEA
ncbi:MAG: 50S ribosomal protein L30 [Coxiella sp. RIFCSPHIGHO2_12_FULL_44_14]|nr:MAG: 50S ribosomal protein L30 [Coxiella sp. RIFCSPHIGHO2_12_FULL_44_14]